MYTQQFMVIIISLGGLEVDQIWDNLESAKYLWYLQPLIWCASLHSKPVDCRGMTCMKPMVAYKYPCY